MTYCEVQFGKFNLDFKVFVKTVDFNGWKLKTERVKKKSKIELLEVLGHRGWIHRETEGF